MCFVVREWPIFIVVLSRFPVAKRGTHGAEVAGRAWPPDAIVYRVDVLDCSLMTVHVEVAGLESVKIGRWAP